MSNDQEELERVSRALTNLTDEEKEKELELHFQIKLDEADSGFTVTKVEKVDEESVEKHECPLCGSTNTEDDPNLYGYWVCLDCRARFEPTT